MKVIFPFAERLPCLKSCTHPTLESSRPCKARPTLAHLLDPLCKLPVSEFIFVVNYQRNEIRSYIDANYNEMSVSFVEQTRNKGLGYTVSLASDYVSREPVLIVDPDAMLEIDWVSFSKSESSTIAVRRVIDERPYGLVELREGRVGCLIQKPRRTDLMLAGCYFVRESQVLFECLHDLIQAGRRWRGEYQLTDALQKMVELGVEMQVQEVQEVDPRQSRSELDPFFGTHLQPFNAVLESNTSRHPNLKDWETCASEQSTF